MATADPYILLPSMFPRKTVSTDVRETDKGYMVDIDMPGFTQENRKPHEVRSEVSPAHRQWFDKSDSKSYSHLW